MKRAFALAFSLSLVLGLGCAQRYDTRLQKTIEHRKYQRRLDNNLGPAPTKGKLQDVDVYVRLPKGLQGPTQTFGLAVIEPGKFDIENSFIDNKRGSSLHLLARVKAPKPAPGKKAAAAPQAAPRGEFKADVLELLRSVYTVDIATAQLKDSQRKGETRTNTYKAPVKPLEADGKEMQVFFHGDKNGPVEVALIFEYPKAEHEYMSPKIDLCLGSFSVGDLAKRLYAGGDEQTAEEGGPAPGVAF